MRAVNPSRSKKHLTKGGGADTGVVCASQRMLHASGCSLVLCAGCWRLVKDTCVYHWETQLLLRPPAFAAAATAEGAPLDEAPSSASANAPAPESPAAEATVPATGTQAQAETPHAVHMLMSTTHGSDTQTSNTQGDDDARGAATHSTDSNASTTPVCSDSPSPTAHLPMPADTVAHAGIPAASGPHNASLVHAHTHAHTHTHTHTHCQLHSNAPLNSGGHALDGHSPALSAAGGPEGEAKSKREGGAEGGCDGPKEVGTEDVGIENEEEQGQQNRLMRSVTQFLKEAAGGAGCEGGSGRAGIGGVPKAAAHSRQNPARLILRDSAEQEAVSIAAMVCVFVRVCACVCARVCPLSASSFDVPSH